MINKIKKGFGTYEMLTVCVMLLIIVAVSLAYVFKTDYKEKYDVMRYNARMFSLTANNFYMDGDYMDGKNSATYYLKMLLDQKLTSEIKNPFQGNKYCNPFTSKVEIKDNKKYVTLECGNYLIYYQDSSVTPYTIYQIGSWSSHKSSNDNQIVTFYNYKQDDKDMFDEDLEYDMFLYEYNKKMNTSYSKIEDLPNQDAIEKITLYRYLKKVN